ncbi:VCBS repeat-containing protein, partial [Bradyrhizobium sp. Gha]
TTSGGTVGWTYSVADNATDDLAAGQTATESFTVSIADGHGGTVDQIVTVTVTGTNEAPTIVAGSTTATGAVTEDATTPDLSTTGTIAFNDVDLIDTHTASVTAASGNTLGGTLTLGAVSESATTSGGTVGWTYTVADNATDDLAAGQTATESFTVTIADGHGGTVDQIVTVTVTGTNEAPTIVAAATTATGAVTEDATTPDLSTTGTIAFNDVDLIDTHTASVTPDSGNTLGGTLTLGAVSESATTSGGTVGWTYTVADNATDDLAAGQTATESFTVSIADGHGGTVDQIVTVTVTGTNEAPTIVAGATTATGAITEVAGTTGSTSADSASGSIAFGDVDLLDTHTISQDAPTFVLSGGSLTSQQISVLTAASTLSLNTSDSTSTGAGAVAWSYSAQDKTFDFLAAGQTLAVTYLVSVKDGHGGTVGQNVVVTITGTNDAPVLNANGGSLSYTENQSATAIDSAVTASDVDSPNLTGATVSIAAGFVSGEDVLAFTNQNGITGTYNAATGVLTLTGSATAAQYQAALEAVTYFNASDNPSGATRTISYQVDDGQAANHASNIVTSTVTVTPVNDAPVAAAPSTHYAATEQTSLTLKNTGLSVSDVD